MADQDDDQGKNLTGNYRVRLLKVSCNEIRRLFKKNKSKKHLWKQMLKLSHLGTTAQSGMVLDLNYEFIKSCQGLDIGELRIDDDLEGCDNLRVIFYKGDNSVKEPLPMIFILSVFQKKRNDFTDGQIKTFKGRRKIVRERFYNNRI